MNITIDEFNKLPLGEIFVSGEIDKQDYPGIDYYGKKNILKWIAKKSDGDHSWAIYYYETGVSENFIKSHGLKVKDKAAILKLVPCDKEVLSKYRK
jgi:hypothetical protein